MVYELPIDLYKDWKDLMYTKELFESVVKELKEHTKNNLKMEGKHE